jgi:pyruvate dehydrogenase E2 component (dihydrolipoamide acetyltransferase)
MVEVIMPKMGDGMEEGTLVEWLKKPGDKVKSGEVIGSIQTDKATLELESPGSGTLSGVLLEAGGTVPVGVPIAAILKEGESLPNGWGTAEYQGGTSAPVAEQAPSGNGVVPSAPVASEPAPVAAKADRVKASPLARKIAAELGVDLNAVVGTGPGGRIVEKDVRSATSAPAAPAAPAPVVVPPTPIAATAEDQTISLNRLRQITAKRTTESKQQVPHFYVTVEVDVEKILALRKMFEEEGSGKVSINDFVVKACAFALRDMPVVNSAFQGTSLLQFGDVHVGIAVALDEGLTVPVVKNADQLSLRQISAAVRDLAGRARDNKLGLDELSGSTFAISNMGMLDVDNFLAIINQPNSAILAIASVRKKVVVNDEDEIEVRSKMNLTCSFDHRTVDGAVGARFINVVKGYLESPTKLLA